MAKCQFFIKNGVQDVGYRLFIMQKILNSTLTGGTAINMPDGRVKVLLEGDRDEIEQFIKELKEEHPELAKNPTMTVTEYETSLHVPDVMRSSQALQMEQFGKSVVFLGKLSQKTDNGFEKLGNKMDIGFQQLGNKMDTLDQNTQNGFEKLGNKMDAGFQQLGDKIDNGFSDVTEKLDKLPREIAKAIREVDAEALKASEPLKA
ncbi:MAG: acylphosphatase [DPANN group archaeon]|nr:acylphosphatase [DPANN group archaeon]